MPKSWSSHGPLRQTASCLLLFYTELEHCLLTSGLKVGQEVEEEPPAKRPEIAHVCSTREVFEVWRN